MSVVALMVVLAAQQPQLPPVRPIGPIERVTTDSLGSIFSAAPLSNGKVYVNDVAAHRIVLVDSAFTHFTVVADSTSGAANGYGNRPAVMVPFRGDSVLFLTSATMSLQVLSPTGAFARTMALPPSQNGLLGLVGGAGVDAQGRILYVVAPRQPPVAPPAPGDNKPFVMAQPDSSFVVRYDLAARKLDTVTVIRVAKSRATVTRSNQGVFSPSLTVFPLQVVDDWTTTPDGGLAVVRGQDYHVDWLSASGAWSSTPKIPFLWEHVDDSQKRALIDSATARMQFWNDSITAALTARGVITNARGAGGQTQFGKTTFTSAEVTDVPDYRPPLRGAGSVRADEVGNLWIITSQPMPDHRAVYDVVNRKGELIDRVRLPAFRGVVGFGAGVVYMSVLDSNKVVHLERARIR